MDRSPNVVEAKDGRERPSRFYDVFNNLPIADRSSILEFCTDKAAGRRTISHWIKFDFDDVAGLESVRPPSFSKQAVGTKSFNAPLLRVTFTIFDVDLNTDMWIRPLKLHDSCYYLTDGAFVKHGT